MVKTKLERRLAWEAQQRALAENANNENIDAQIRAQRVSTAATPVTSTIISPAAATMATNSTENQEQLVEIDNLNPVHVSKTQDDTLVNSVNGFANELENEDSSDNLIKETIDSKQAERTENNALDFVQVEKG